MIGVICKDDTQRKLEILSADAQYDLACACSTHKQEHRRRGRDGRWIYPVTLANGGKSTLLKTLMTNVCANDCRYCPLRAEMDVRRCSLGVEETVRVFLDYWRRGEVQGVFLSSGVAGDADASMDRLVGVAWMLRKRYGFGGYIHLKILPGASTGAIEEAVRLSSAVSLNIETPGAEYLAKLSAKKRYMEDIIEPMRLISRLTGRGGRYEHVKQTTQFIVGAAGESDAEIVKYTYALYKRMGVHRVYFSAYQRAAEGRSVGGGRTADECGEQLLIREHRLYQVDFLFRRYGFRREEIYFDERGNLPLEMDPKQVWALRHPEAFPVDVNRASREELLRVPGLGPVTVGRILARRRLGRLRRLEDIGPISRWLLRAEKYLAF